MKKFIATIFLLIPIAVWADTGFAGLVRGTVGGSSGGGPATAPPSNILPPEVVGLDWVVSPATSIPLTARNGRWDTTAPNAPTGFSYCWHYTAVSPVCIGTAQTFSLSPTLDPTIIGKTIQVDVTAVNSAGSTTVRSHWFGPIETGAPPAPPEYESVANGNVGSTTLVGPPAHFLLNGHAVFPGCNPPPASPPNTATTGDPNHVWYFDPVNGSNTNTGHAGSPFKDIAAFSTSTPGYPASPLFGFGRTIQPGDTVYVEPGWGADGAAVVGDIVATSLQSTTDGTNTGAPNFTWILGDPNAATRPVLHKVWMIGGKGFVFKGFNIEMSRGGIDWSSGTPRGPFTVIGTVSNPGTDIYAEDLYVDMWINHSNDPWNPSPYPTTGGYSDGTVLTASPVFSVASNLQDPVAVNATASANSNTLTLSAAPNCLSLATCYIWSKGYWRPTYQGATDVNASGIPNGTKIASWNSSTNVATIAPCDPVTDAATGCPSTPIPGCDPRTSPTTGGCPGGVTVPWNGTTRALSGDSVNFTDQMVIVPAGYWNTVNWDGGAGNGFRFAGQLQLSPNILNGAKCLSAKDNVVRHVYNGFQLANVMNSIVYNNKVKWTSADDFDAYSNHRVWYIHNYGSDPTLIWAHQDGIQFGDTNGQVAVQYYYNNAAMENEFIQNTALDNPFPRPMQGINTTENYHWGMYVCCNLLQTSNNGLTISGKYNVLVNNTMIGQAIQIKRQAKGSDTSPIFGLLANNVGNGVGRDNSVARVGSVTAVSAPSGSPPAVTITGFNFGNSTGSVYIGGKFANLTSWSSTSVVAKVPSTFVGTPDTTNTSVFTSYCDLTLGDGVTINTNVSLPFVPGLNGASQAYCTLDNPPVAAPNANPGSWQGLETWNGTDWRTNQSGVSPLFTGFNPVNYTNAPALQQGYGAIVNPCVQGAFPWIGNPANCPSGNGIINARPNNTFNGFAGAISYSFAYAQYLPANPGVNGQYAVIQNSAGSGGSSAPLGIWTSCAPPTDCTTNANGTTIHWKWVQTAYNPPLIAQGTSLGPQQPFADHDGNAWANPPSIGAYELH